MAIKEIKRLVDSVEHTKYFAINIKFCYAHGRCYQWVSTRVWMQYQHWKFCLFSNSGCDWRPGSLMPGGVHGGSLQKSQWQGTHSCSQNKPLEPRLQKLMSQKEDHWNRMSFPCGQASASTAEACGFLLHPCYFLPSNHQRLYKILIIEWINYNRYRSLNHNIGVLVMVFTCHRHLFPSSLCVGSELAVGVQKEFMTVRNRKTWSLISQQSSLTTQSNEQLLPIHSY